MTSSGGVDRTSEPDEHFPWHYTEFGVECVCGLPMDRNETCAAMREREGVS